MLQKCSKNKPKMLNNYPKTLLICLQYALKMLPNVTEMLTECSQYAYKCQKYMYCFFLLDFIDQILWTHLAPLVNDLPLQKSQVKLETADNVNF